MKSGLIKMQVLGILFLFSQAISAQFDDTYFNAKDDAAFVADFKNETPVRQRQQEEVYSSEEENENLDEYSYSSRIDRFHRNGINGNNYSNFDNWWSGCDSYSPSYGYGNTFNTGIYYGSPWGGGFGYSPVSSWGMSPWNSFGWNSWNPFWGYNSWNNWGFTPMSMYNWPYYGGGYGFGNSYFINNYYGYGSPWVHHGNGWNGWNNGNGGETTDKLYMSRKGGSVSSSVKGRDASPRRVLLSDNNQKEEKTGVGQDAATTTRSNSADRVRKSSASSDATNSQNATSRTETRRAVQNPVRNQDSYNQRDFQDSQRFDNSPSRNSWDSTPSRSGMGNQGSSSRSSSGSSGGGGGSRRGGGK
jgi:hypothetical protein